MAGRFHPHSVQALLWLVAAWWLLLGLPAPAVVLPPRAVRTPVSEAACPEVVQVTAVLHLRIAVVLDGGIWFGGADAVAIARYALAVPPYMTTFPHDGAGNRIGDAKHSYTWGAYGDRPPHRFRKCNTFNARGDVVGQTKDDKTVTFETAYQADGRTAPGVTNPGSSPDRQRANTKEEDPTGLLNEGFRYRDLETGVFLTRDPAGFIDGPNLYCYVKQNPWSSFDPDGLFLFGLYDGTAGQCFSDVGKVWVGYGTAAQKAKEALTDVVTSTFKAIANPVQSAKAVKQAASNVADVAQYVADNPSEARSAAVEGIQENASQIKEKWNSGLEGQSELVGDSLITVMGAGVSLGPVSRIKPLPAAKTPLPKPTPKVKPGSYDDKPPGWNDSWEWHSSTRAKPGSDGWRWRDPQGGEWRRHVPDKHHPEAHWDYNPNTQWNSPWSNIDDNGNFLLFTSP